LLPTACKNTRANWPQTKVLFRRREEEDSMKTANAATSQPRFTWNTAVNTEVVVVVVKAAYHLSSIQQSLAERCP